MKRSEMLDIIDKILYENSNYICSSTILEKIEEAGMLPPNRMRYLEMENGNTLCSEVCEWEEE